MTYRSKQLQRLSNKQIFEDIKKYIKTSHSFYETKVPELTVLAKRLHEEYDLTRFYKVFNKLWNSGYHEERSLAIHALQLYEEEFDLRTWYFLKPKLKDMKSWDKIDSVGIEIIGKILLKYPRLEIEIIKMVNSKNKWFIRMGMMSTLPSIRNGNIKLAMRIAEMHINNKEEHIQKAVGIILYEISRVKPEIAKKFILKNIHMPMITFNYATEDLKELKGLRQIKKLQPSLITKLFDWR